MTAPSPSPPAAEGLHCCKCKQGGNTTSTYLNAGLWRCLFCHNWFCYRCGVKHFTEEKECPRPAGEVEALCKAATEFRTAVERACDERLQAYKHEAREARAAREAAEQTAARLREELAAIYARHADVSQAWASDAERADTLFAALAAAKAAARRDGAAEMRERCANHFIGAAQIVAEEAKTEALELKAAGLCLAAELLQRASDRIRALPLPSPPAAEANGWRDIATAPKDGTAIRALVETMLIHEEHIPAALMGGWKRTTTHDRIIGWRPLDEGADATSPRVFETAKPLEDNDGR